MTITNRVHDHFKVGDSVSYITYNGGYSGTISKITNKTVTIKENKSFGGQNHRISHNKFADKVRRDN